jgi:hypothetical protein
MFLDGSCLATASGALLCGRTDDQALSALELVCDVDLVARRALHQRHIGDFIPNLHTGACGCVEQTGGGQCQGAGVVQATGGEHDERQGRGG